MHEREKRRLPTLLGLAGVLPFAIAAVLIWVPAMRELATLALIAYGATILSFLGAVHWGVALSHPEEFERDRRYLFSITPALVAWGALLLPPLFALPLLAAAFFAVALIERFNFREFLPGWYLLLRMMLTAGAVLFLLVGLLARY